MAAKGRSQQRWGTMGKQKGGHVDTQGAGSATEDYQLSSITNCVFHFSLKPQTLATICNYYMLHVYDYSYYNRYTLNK